jgi:hypothetical protein
MENDKLDITKINELEPSMQGFFISGYIRENITSMTIKQINDELNKYCNNFYFSALNETYYEVAYELAITTFRNTQNMENVLAVLESKCFDNEIVNKVTKKINEMIKKTQENILKSFFVEYVPIVTIACIIGGHNGLKYGNLPFKGGLIFILSFWLLGASLYLLSKSLKKKNIQKVLNFK